MLPQQHRGPLFHCRGRAAEILSQGQLWVGTVFSEDKSSLDSPGRHRQGSDKEQGDLETWERDIWPDKPANLEPQRARNTRRSSNPPCPPARGELSSLTVDTAKTRPEAEAPQNDLCPKICLYLPYFLQTNRVGSSPAHTGQSKPFSRKKYCIHPKNCKICKYALTWIRRAVLEWVWRTAGEIRLLVCSSVRPDH